MNTTAAKQKTLFLNGVEVDAFELTGNFTRDLATARRFLAKKGIDKPRQRLTLRIRAPSAWRFPDR